MRDWMKWTTPAAIREQAEADGKLVDAAAPVPAPPPASAAPTRAELEARIAAHGYSLRYVEFCEDARTPGFPGQIRGVTDRERREVKIGLRANPTEADMLDILAHELRHLDEPEWDCGNRDMFGRGGPVPSQPALEF